MIPKQMLVSQNYHLKINQGIKILYKIICLTQKGSKRGIEEHKTQEVYRKQIANDTCKSSHISKYTTCEWNKYSSQKSEIVSLDEKQRLGGL
jgi:hypothetical protein